MRTEDLLISAVLRGAGVRTARRLGVTNDLFLQRKGEWRYIEDHPTVSKPTFRARFPDFKIIMVDPEEIELLVEEAMRARADYELGQLFAKYQKQLGRTDALTLGTKMNADITRLVLRFTRGRDVNIFEEWQPLVDEVEARSNAVESGDSVGWPFGLPTLDDVFGGILAPDLITIVARQGEFKTWMSLYFATSALVAGAKVMYVSLEMDYKQIAYRVHTLMSQRLTRAYKKKFKDVFSNTGLIRGTVDVDEYRVWVLKARKYAKKGLIVPDPGTSGTVGQFDVKVEEHKPDLAVFDYFGLSIGDTKVDNWVEAKNTSRGFKQIAMKYNIPVILNAQANRGSADSKDVPALHQISLSDSIGADSDRVLSLRLRKGDELIMGVIKNRHGRHGDILHFDMDIDQGVVDEIRTAQRVARKQRSFKDDDE